MRKRSPRKPLSVGIAILVGSIFLVCIFVAIIMLFFPYLPTSYKEFNDSSVITDERADTDDSIEPDTHYHQVFFGLWEVVDFIPGGRFSDPDKAREYIGSTVCFIKNEVQVDEEVVHWEFFLFVR